MKKRSAVRRHLLAGLIVILPVTATVFVLWWIFQLLDGLLGRFLYPAIGGLFGRERFIIPGLGLLSLFLLLVGIGWIAERTIGSRIIAWWHDLLETFPLTRRIYTAANRIVRTVFGAEERPFKTVVLVEYPSPGRWALGFLSAPTPRAIQTHVPESVSVFVPTTPNPTTGFLIIVRRDVIREIAMTVDEAFTMILSAGAVAADGSVIEVSPPNGSAPTGSAAGGSAPTAATTGSAPPGSAAGSLP